MLRCVDYSSTDLHRAEGDDQSLRITVTTRP